MPLYAYMNEAGDTILREKFYPDPLDPVLLARKNILEIFITDPPFDPATQIRTGPVETIQADRIDRVFTVRAKTVPELDAEDDARSASFFDGRLMKAFALVVKDEINILRQAHALADRTDAQLRDAVIAKYKTLR